VAEFGDRWQIPFSQAQQSDAAAALALFTRLNRHAPLQDIERRQGIAARATGPAREVLDRLKVVTARLSDPTLPSAQRQQAETESEQLHQELVRLLPTLRPRLVEPDAVAQRLPADALLVEFQRYTPYDPRQPEAKRVGSPRYLAVVLAPGGQIQAVDLGPAEALEQPIATALQHTREQQPEATASWGRVADAVFGPLQGALAGRRRLLLAPDGELHRVPFSALALLAGDIRTLPPGVRLQTIGSGRDLVPVAGEKAPASGPLVLADPLSPGWPALPAASKEGAAVANSLGAPLLQGPAAKVSVLDQARGPRLIHVAGHGYFDAQASGDPLLASGLVLAGADQARLPSRVAAPAASGGAPLDDGYLTAKEAARLQLDGTELVVLSACETGLGKQRTGEGLFGLQRALTVAGARGTLLSLWKVPDQASQTFMERFYALLKQGKAADQAVRQVQEEFRDQPTIGGQPKPGAWSDPYYWAAWQYTGVPDSPR
jgi:CHAT domain-containing protein